MTRTTEELARFFLEEQDRLKAGPPPELCTLDFSSAVNSNPPMSREAHDQFARMCYTAFPNLRHEIEDVFGMTSGAAVRFRLTGTQAEPFMGIPASGKAISVFGNVLIHVENGRVKKLQ